MSGTDQITKQILLKAPRSKVWRALIESNRFGAWFGMELDGSFEAGKKMTGKIVPTQVDEAVAAAQKPYAGTPVELWIIKIEPESRFSFEWHPYEIDKTVDSSLQPRTLITFVLEEQSGGTLLTITESGFDRIPPSRKAAAMKSNEGGWEAQTQLIKKYLERDRS